MAGFSPIAGPGLPGDILKKKKEEEEQKVTQKYSPVAAPGTSLKNTEKKITNKNSSGSGKKSGSATGGEKAADRSPAVFGAYSPVAGVPDPLERLKNRVSESAVGNNFFVGPVRRISNGKDIDIYRGGAARRRTNVPAAGKTVDPVTADYLSRVSPVTRTLEKHGLASISDFDKILSFNRVLARQEKEQTIQAFLDRGKAQNGNKHFLRSGYEGTVRERLAQDKEKKQKAARRYDRMLQREVEKKYGLDPYTSTLSDIQEIIWKNEKSINSAKTQADAEALVRDNQILGGMLGKDSIYRETERGKQLVQFETLDEQPDFFSRQSVNKKERDRVYRVINNVDSFGDYVKAYEEGGAVPQVSSGKTFSYVDTDDRKYLFMTALEKSRYNYLYNTEGKRAAKEYLSFLEPDLNKRQTEDKAKSAAAFAQKHPVAASVISSAEAPARGIGGVISTVGDVGRVLSGKEIDPYSKYKQLAHTAQAVRETVSSSLDKDWQRFLYNAGMSVLDNVIEMGVMSLLTVGAAPALKAIDNAADLSKAVSALNKITKYGVSSMVFGDVAAGTVIDGKAKGYSDEKALGLGLVSALIEGATEKWSLDVLLKKPKTLFTSVLRGMAAEGSEEGLSAAANMAVDGLVNGSDADIAKRIEELKQDGYSDMGALTLALTEGILPDMAAGALGGGLMGGMHYSVLKSFGGKQQKTKSGKNGVTFDDIIYIGKEGTNKNAKNSADNDLLLSIGQNGQKKKRYGSLLAPENRARFSKEVDGVFDGGFPQRSALVLGDTPPLLQKYGAGDVPVTVSTAAVRKMAYPTGYLGLEHGHNLGIAAVKHLPEQISSPLAILRSNTVDGSLVLLTEWADRNDNRVVVPVHLNKKGVLGVENRVTSAYGKKDFSTLLFDENGNSTVLYTKGNESIDSLLASSGLQLPGAQTAISGQLPSLPSEDTLIDYSISRKRGNYNPDLQKNGSNLQTGRTGDAFDEIVGMGSAKRPRSEQGVLGESAKNDIVFMTRDRKNESEKIYDYTKPFAEQVEDWKQGKIPQNDTLLVGGTPEVLKEIGFNALPVTMNQTHVEYAYNGKNGDIKSDHVIKDLIKDLPEKLEHPLAVFASESRPGRVVALLEMDKPNTGNKVVVPVEVDGFGRQNNIRIDSNALTSVYGRKNALVQLKEAIENDSADDCRLFYWNKNEAVSLLQRAGLQLPSGLPQDGFVHSIRENGSKVNMKFENETESQQFKRWFGDWKKNPNRASKVVNADGTPKVVHSVKAPGAEGYIFSDVNQNSVEMLDLPGGGGQTQAYLNIKNPLFVTISEAQAADGSFLNRYAAQAKENGMDGVIFRVISDNGSVVNRVYSVFAPEQVKAVSNVGTFSRDTENVLFDVKESGMTGSRNRAERRGFMRWSKKQKISLNAFRRVVEALGYRVIDAPRAERVKADVDLESIDGYVDYKLGEVYINPNAQNPQNVVMKHELTHVMERVSTKYLKQASDYIKTTLPDVWERTRQQVIDKYDRLGIDVSEHLESETMAEIASEFSTDKAINRYGTSARFCRNISLWFSYMAKKIKSVFGDLTVADKLEIAAYKWEQALRQAEMGANSGTGGVVYAIKKDKNGNEYWEIDSGKDIFKNLKSAWKIRDEAFKFLLGNRDNKVVVHDENGKEIRFIRVSAQEFTQSEESHDLYENDPENFKRKMRMIPSLQDILLHSPANWHSPDLKNHNMFQQGGFKNYRGRVRVDNVIFNTVVRVGVADFGNVFYDINLEVDTILPHAKGASEIKNRVSTSNDSVSQGAAAVNNNFMQNEENDATLDFLLAGEKAKTHDPETLDKAKRLSAFGETPRQIWKETGWVKGQEGKWRFELDDSKMKFRKKDGKISDVLRISELNFQYMTEGLSDAESDEFLQLRQAASRGEIFAPLSDVISYDLLFEAYPVLKEVLVKSDYHAIGMGKAAYDPGTKTIYLSPQANGAKLRQTLLHEIQHAVQDEEGFASGSSPDYWRERSGISAKEAERLYENTVGEIEARDVERRADLTEEERKNTFPESAKPNDDAVFAGEETGNAFVLYHADSAESDAAGIISKLKEHLQDIARQPKVFHVKKNVLDGLGEKASEAIGNYFNSIGNKAVNPEIGVVELSKRGAKSTVFHGTSSEKLKAVGAIKDVIEKGTIFDFEKNWKNRGYDTYLIAANGTVMGQPRALGVVVKAYPGSNMNNKFYLHEVIEMELTHHLDAAADNGVTHVSKSTPIDSVSQGETSVNSYSMQTQENNAFDRILRMSGGNKEKRITFDDLAGAQFLKNTVADGENGDIIEKEDAKKPKVEEAQVKLPEKDAQMKHIFREAEGHLADTSFNRNLIERVVNNPKNYVGKDSYGTDWYAQIQPDGSQVWARALHGFVTNAGLNNSARKFDPRTGLNKNPLK